MNEKVPTPSQNPDFYKFRNGSIVAPGGPAWDVTYHGCLFLARAVDAPSYELMEPKAATWFLERFAADQTQKTLTDAQKDHPGARATFRFDKLREMVGAPKEDASFDPCWFAGAMLDRAVLLSALEILSVDTQDDNPVSVTVRKDMEQVALFGDGWRVIFACLNASEPNDTTAWPKILTPSMGDCQRCFEDGLVGAPNPCIRHGDSKVSQLQTPALTNAVERGDLVHLLRVLRTHVNNAKWWPLAERMTGRNPVDNHVATLPYYALLMNGAGDDCVREVSQAFEDVTEEVFAQIKKDPKMPAKTFLLAILDHAIAHARKVVSKKELSDRQLQAQLVKAYEKVKGQPVTAEWMARFIEISVDETMDFDARTLPEEERMPRAVLHERFTRAMMQYFRKEGFDVEALGLGLKLVESAPAPDPA